MEHTSVVETEKSDRRMKPSRDSRRPVDLQKTDVPGQSVLARAASKEGNNNVDGETQRPCADELFQPSGRTPLPDVRDERQCPVARDDPSSGNMAGEIRS